MPALTRKSTDMKENGAYLTKNILELGINQIL